MWTQEMPHWTATRFAIVKSSVETFQVLFCLLKVENALFELNQAHELDTMMTEEGHHSLRMWQEERKPKEAAIKVGSPIDCADCSFGRGGALFVELKHQLHVPNINFYLRDLSFRRNSAGMGGRVHFIYTTLSR